MPSKLNWLLSNTMPGTLVLQAWLSKHGISPSLTQKYAASNWLQKRRAGVYTRTGRSSEWLDAVHCLQTQCALSVHLAGISSLAYQGRTHYLSLGEETVWLALEEKVHLPAWFMYFADEQWYRISNVKLTHFTEEDFCHLTIKHTEIKASNMELAALETLATVSNSLSFEHAAKLFQGLVNLSPIKVQSLLERSRSVQVNRLFLFFAHYYKHAWLSRLDESKINIGSGKRQIVKGGKLDKRYQITVPENYAKDTINGG